MVKTHGKQDICRAFYFWCTVKSLFAVRFLFAMDKIFAVYFISGARQRAY
jgi:hypothetical protein